MPFGFIVGLLVLAAVSINVFLGLALVAFIAWMAPEFVRSWRHDNERMEKALKGASTTQTLRRTWHQTPSIVGVPFLSHLLALRCT